MFFAWFKHGLEVVVRPSPIGLFEGSDAVNDNVVGLGRGLVAAVVGLTVEGGKRSVVEPVSDHDGTVVNIPLGTSWAVNNEWTSHAVGILKRIV